MSSRIDGTRSQTLRTGQGESRLFRTEPGSSTPERDARQFLSVGAGALGARRPYGVGSTGYPGARRFSPEHTSSINASTLGRLADFPDRRRGVSVDGTALNPGGGEPAAGAEHQTVRTDAGSATRQRAQTEQPGSASNPPAPSPALREHDEPATNAEDMVNDDPRNPLKNHRNSVFYNMYPARGRSVARTRRPPSTGYGTSYFQNGKSIVLITVYAGLFNEQARS